VVVGERVTFDSAFPRPGDEVTPIVHFRVEGGPVNLSIGYVTTSPLPYPTALSIGTFNTGAHNFRLSRFRIPDPAPSEICLSINVSFVGTAGAPQPLITGACLRGDIRVSGTGRGERHVLRDLPSWTLPDLAVVRHSLHTSHGYPGTLGRGTADISFGIANLGGTAAEGVEWKVVLNFIDCVRELLGSGFGRRLDTSGLGAPPARRVGSIPRIAPGETVDVRARFSESRMSYITGSFRQEQRWVPCEIVGVKVEIDPNNRIREASEGNNIFIFPGSRTWE
jgi:hypothetical protein